MAKRNVTPDGAAQLWAERLTAAAAPNGAIQAGVMAVTTSPGTAAAAKQSLWLQNLQASAGKWAARVSAVNLQTWQQITVAKGVTSGRIASGATTAIGPQGKMVPFMTSLLQFENSQLQRLNQTNPRGTTQQNIARATAWMNAMTNFSQTYNPSI